MAFPAKTLEAAKMQVSPESTTCLGWVDMWQPACQQGRAPACTGGQGACGRSREGAQCAGLQGWEPPLPASWHRPAWKRPGSETPTCTCSQSTARSPRMQDRVTIHLQLPLPEGGAGQGGRDTLRNCPVPSGGYIQNQRSAVTSGPPCEKPEMV